MTMKMRGPFLCFMVVICGLFNYSSGDNTSPNFGSEFQDGERRFMGSVATKSARSLTRERPIWNPESLSADKNDRHDRRRLKKHERRKERQERRERRKHRHHLQDSQSRIPITFPRDSPSHFREKISAHSNKDEVVNTGEAALMSPNNVVSDLGWLETNLTSIWLTLQYIQRDVKQLRRQLRINNQIKAAKGRMPTHDPCPPDWVEEPGACTDPQGLICGGKGKCSCGQCMCEPPYYGINCHCNDMVCSSSDGVLCGGAGRGQCRCGACVCRPEFTGSDCSCSLSTSECKKENEQICNGNGECICNRCHCQDGFTGMFCDELIYSASVCERLKPCVLCIAYGKKSPRCEDCNIHIEIVEELASSRATCLMVNLGCILKYGYVIPENESDKITVLVSRDRSCP